CTLEISFYKLYKGFGVFGGYAPQSRGFHKLISEILRKLASPKPCKSLKLAWLEAVISDANARLEKQNRDFELLYGG
ncbi:MAG TPA: hypothetical protein V6D19_06300, partial [Stenomitos sp.]